MEVALNAFQPFGLPIAKAIPDLNELLALHKANMEALVHANTILAKGIEEIGEHLITFTCDMDGPERARIGTVQVRRHSYRSLRLSCLYLRRGDSR
jgi:hypothetical protein